MRSIFLRIFLRNRAASEAEKCGGKHKLPHGCGHSDGGLRFGQEVPKMRVKITLACTECKQRNYNTKKNKKNDPDRLEMNKYCKFCKKHTLHKETK